MYKNKADEKKPKCLKLNHDFSSDIIKIAEKIKQAGGRLYLVGGAVRDKIINNSLFFIFCHLFSLDMRDLGWITSKLFGICTIYEANSKSVTIQAPQKIPHGFHFLKP